MSEVHVAFGECLLENFESIGNFTHVKFQEAYWKVQIEFLSKRNKFSSITLHVVLMYPITLSSVSGYDLIKNLLVSWIVLEKYEVYS